MNSDKSNFDYLYHYNPYTELWACFCRDDYRNYFNGSKSIEKIGKGETIEQALKDKLNEK